MIEKKAKCYVLEHAVKMFDDESLMITDIKLVWSCKTLQNWKGIFVVSPETHNGILYEVTYNGDDQEYYIDVYHKIDNVRHQVIACTSK